MIIRIRHDDIIRCVTGGYYCNQWIRNYLTCPMEEKITFSLKVGKKKKLITGRTRWDIMPTGEGFDYYWILRWFPNNEEKVTYLLKLAMRFR